MVRAAGTFGENFNTLYPRPSNIRVAVRVRTLIPSERSQGARSVIHVLDKKLVVLMDPGTTASDDFLRLHKSRERRYAFDMAFDESASQRDVHERATEGVVNGVLDGVNATVFVYGATAAGKTYTMLGSPPESGLMSLTLEELFQKIESLRQDKSFKVKCSFIEIYNENVRDLLGGGQDLDLREDPVKGMCVAGVSEIGGIESVDAIMELLQKGNKNRTTEPTAANITSSRSHAILQVIIEQSEKGQGMAGNIQIGKLSLIDLAGSERASVTNNKGIRLLEGANINRSLLALGNCITALAEGGKGVFVPYRDSKLTRLLKDSLGGNCMTVMIANISPSNFNYEDTRNTLKYANRAKNIRTDVSVNRVTVHQHISNYNEIISELKSVVYDLKGKLSMVEKTSESVKEASERWKQDLMDNIDERVQLKKSSIDLKNEIALLNSERLKYFAKNSTITTPRNIRTPGQWDEGEVEETPGTGMVGNAAAASPDDDDAFIPSDDVSCQDENSQDVHYMQKISERITELRSRKRQIDRRIGDNQATMQSLQAELPARVKDEDVCAFLSLLYRNQILEIEAMDRDDQLDWLHRHNEEVLKLKHDEIELLRNQIKLRDSIIDRVKASFTGDVQDDIQDTLNALVNVADVDSPDTPSLPYSPFRNSRNPICEVNIHSPTSIIPTGCKIKGIGESILVSVKNSPRFYSRKEDACVEQNLCETTAVPPLPLVPCGEISPARRTSVTVNKKQAPHTVRSGPVIHELSVHGSNHAISTRRARLTDRPSGSKQQARTTRHHAQTVSGKLKK